VSDETLTGNDLLDSIVVQSRGGREAFDHLQFVAARGFVCAMAKVAAGDLAGLSAIATLEAMLPAKLGDRGPSHVDLSLLDDDELDPYGVLVTKVAAPGAAEPVGLELLPRYPPAKITRQIPTGNPLRGRLASVRPT
jgi:hypothetical protein